MKGVPFQYTPAAVNPLLPGVIYTLRGKLFSCGAYFAVEERICPRKFIRPPGVLSC